MERTPNAIQTPVASIVKENNQHFVLVKTPQGVQPQPVKTGSNNERFVIIDEGLEAGQEVLVDPERYRDVVEFPAAS